MSFLRSGRYCKRMMLEKLQMLSLLQELVGDQSKKARQLKVVLENSHQTFLVINSLVNLKGKKVYQGVSITEDFTLFERSMIKEWSNKGKERNKKEPSDSKYIWRVRGSPSKGLYIKRMEIKVAVLTD